MFVSFGMAEAYGGECILRFDDTNPEAEKKEYIDHIQEIVAWMGWSPAQVHFILHCTVEPLHSMRPTAHSLAAHSVARMWSSNLIGNACRVNKLPDTFRG